MTEETKEYLQSMVKNNYQEIAAHFDLTRKKHTWPELEKIISFLKDGDSVLDVGCGNGRLLENIKDKKINYLGVDNSSNLISLAQKNYPQHNFQIADILELEKMISQKYDLVISVAVLHHLPSLELRQQAVLQLLKMANSSGRVIFSVWRLWNKTKYLKLIFKNTIKKIFFHNDLEIRDLVFPWKDNQGEKISQRYYHAFTKGELKSLLRSLGLKNYQITTENNNYWVAIDTP